MDNRKNSFEFYGYDFMLDDDMRVWLIEVNSSPSMDQGTPTTEVLVDRVLTDLPKVVIDYPKSGYRRDCDTGGFVLIHRAAVEVARPPAAVKELLIEGKKMKVKNTKKKVPIQPPPKRIPLAPKLGIGRDLAQSKPEQKPLKPTQYPLSQ